MAFTLNRRLAQLIDSSGQLNTGKIPNDYITSDHVADNSITTAMLHTGFTLPTSSLTSIDTDNVTEGSSNLYYTNARADARIAAATTDDLSEGSTNLYYTDARVATYISGNRDYGNITTTGYIAGPATFTIDPAAVGDNTGTVVIAGNLQVDGTTTTINSTTLTVDDKLVTLASGSANAGAANGAGIEVDISGATNPSLTYDGTNDEWDFNKNVNVTGTITASGNITGTLATAAQTNITSLGTLTSLNTSGFVTLNKSVASGNFLTDATIYPLRLTNDDTTAGNAVAMTFGQGGFDFTNFIASVRTGTGNDPKGDLVFGGRPSDGSPYVERMRIQADGHVGIGETDPDYALDISNATSAKINLKGGTNQNGINFAAAGNGGVSSSQYYLGVGSGLMGVDYGAVLLDVTNNRSVLFDDQSTSKLGFYNNKMIINSSGNVGIGEATPLGRLHVKSADSGASADGGADELVIEGSGDSGLSILSGASNYGNILFSDSSDAAAGRIRYEHNNNALNFGTNGSWDRFYINSSGNVGIGTTSPFSSARLQVNTGTNLNLAVQTGTTLTNGMKINAFNDAGSANIPLEINGSVMLLKTGETERMRIGSDGLAEFTSTRSEWAMRLTSGSNRGGIVLDKPGTSTIMGSMLMLSGDETFRLGTQSYYHVKMDQSGNTYFGNSTNNSFFNSSGNQYFEHTGQIAFESAANDYSNIIESVGYASQTYGTTSRYWNHLRSKGGTHITINTDGGHTGSENMFDDFVIWQGTQDTAEPLFRVSNTGRVIAKQNYEIGNHKTNREEFGVNAINTVDTATSDINTTVTNTYENRSGVYWLNFNSKRFRAFVRPQWMQGRNWVLAAKFFAFNDMPSGSALWTNDASWNGGDFDLNNGHFAKYGNVWRYFGFNRLAMQMGDRVAPIMQFSSTQTLYGAFSGGRAANGGGVSPTSTDPALSTGAVYHTMTNYIGPNFTDLGGLEDKMQSYGLNKWAAASSNSTSGNNNGSADLNSNTSYGFQLTVEDAHKHVAGNDSIGFAGAWIGCPMDEGNCNPLATSSNSGADSGFGFGGGAGNTARTWTSGIAEWAKGNEVANYLPGYIWLSID